MFFSSPSCLVTCAWNTWSTRTNLSVLCYIALFSIVFPPIQNLSVLSIVLKQNKKIQIRELNTKINHGSPWYLLTFILLISLFCCSTHIKTTTILIKSFTFIPIISETGSCCQSRRVTTKGGSWRHLAFIFIIIKCFDYIFTKRICISNMYDSKEQISPRW